VSHNLQSSIAEAQKELAKLPLSNDIKKLTVQIMKDFSGVKAFFKGIADIHAVIYDGPEPHPRGSQATKIIQALQNLALE
jgi:hypothetical protein